MQGVKYFPETLSATLNYIISDRLVFKTKSQKTSPEQQVQIFYPEGLELSHSRTNRVNYQDNKNKYYPPNNKIRLFSIVIPAYNEEEGIETTLQLISQKLDSEKISYEILVVNDNSRDNTEIVLAKICQDNPKIRYINNYYPNGFGFAVRCGLENFTGDAVAIVMADSSDSPENIVHYYHKLQEGYECVFGSRFIRGGKVVDYPQHKLLINRLANLFVKTDFTHIQITH